MKIEPTPPITPRGSPLARAGAEEDAGEGERAEYRWDLLVPLVVHPCKVAIIEALTWIGEPLSAKQLASSFDEAEFNRERIKHHLASLKGLGQLEKVRTGSAPGAREQFYWWRSR